MEKETKMKTYTIYHIPGKKIGCSDEPDKRVEAQGYTHYEILEQHTDIYLASDREQELQREYGYRVDGIPYYLSIEHRRKAGKKHVQSGHLDSIRSKAGKIGGKISGKITGKWAVESGHLMKVRVKAWEITSKAISAYKKDTGEYVGTYTSQNECARQLSIHAQAINSVLKGYSNHAGGYTFKKEVKL